MKQLPAEWLSYINKDEKEYLSLLIASQFIEIAGLIIIKAHYDPETFLTNWMPIIQEYPNEVEKTENTINHVHLGDFTENIDLQKTIGEYIRTKWHGKLEAQFPNVQFEIPLSYENGEWELGLWMKRINAEIPKSPRSSR